MIPFIVIDNEIVRGKYQLNVYIDLLQTPFKCRSELRPHKSLKTYTCKSALFLYCLLRV